MNRVVLFLDSAGGQVEEGDGVIEALNEIKLRHQLITVVAHGKLFVRNGEEAVCYQLAEDGGGGAAGE